MNIHVFNPEHDIALAANSRFWTSPHAGRQLRADLGWLPVLWAEDRDVVIVDDIAKAENAVRKIKRNLPDVTFVTMDKLLAFDLSDAIILPWGWDLSITQQLRRAGVNESLLPSDQQLERIRNLSDRATACRLLEYLCKRVPDCIGESRIITNVSEIENARAEWGEIVLKSPWSSSGRGVRYMDDRPNNIIRWAEKVLRTQGHLIVERRLDKILDFGMEFSAGRDGIVTYEGLSLFDTSGGAYTGSVLATEEEKMKIFENYHVAEQLEVIQSAICMWMKNELSNDYYGPFGVDMMICRNSVNDVLVNPCVEINLRRTMGHVALAISPEEPERQQVMRIGYEGANYHFRVYNNHEILF